MNDRRSELASHLRWLDACQQQHLVDLARARIAQAAKTGTAQHEALVAAQNLAGDIDSHQREARRVDDLAAGAEQRLVDYCAGHAQALPTLDNPAITADGRRPEPRLLPAPSTGAR